MSWDQSTFDRTLEEYAQVSKRTIKQILDTKAYFVARKAIWFTGKADTYKMKQQLGGFVTVSRMNKKGRLVHRRELKLQPGTGTTAPLAALIVQARRKKDGMPGLYGSKMARAVRELMSARSRSVAFLKSGWLPAVREMAPLADTKKNAPAMDKDARQVGQPKGVAYPAGLSFDARAQIINRASAMRDTKDSLHRYAEQGLIDALEDEEASMRDYMEQRMKPDADRFNAEQRK